MSRSRRNPARARLVFVDSGAWIAFFSARDGHHPEAERRLRRAAADRILLITSNLVLAEVHRLLLFRAGPPAARRALDVIESSALLRIVFATKDHHDGARGWLARFADQEITYTDAASFAIMELSHCTAALSFDRDFVIAGFALWNP